MTIEQPEALRLANVIKGSGQFTDLLSLDAAAAELRRMHTENEILIAENASMRSAFDRLGCAYDEWIEKTDWVQKSTKLAELGRHRADILRLRIESLHTENETLRHKLQTLDELGAAGDDVQLLRMGYAAARLEIARLQAQLEAVGAVPDGMTHREFGQFLSDVLTAAGLVSHGEQSKGLGQRLADAVMRLRAAPQPAAQAQEDAVAQAVAAEREACVAACAKVRKRAKDTASGSFVTDAGKDIFNAMAAGAHNCMVAIAGRDQHAS